MTECSPLLNRDEKRLNLNIFITPEEARRVIQLFGTFRRDKTKLAFDKLFWFFVWKPNKLRPSPNPLIFVEVVPDDPKDIIYGEKSTQNYPWLQSLGEDTRLNEENIDTIRKAATDGTTLWINRESIMNKKFDQMDTHFGELPRGISHFSAVMLHEFGHVLRKRANNTTVVRMLRNSPDIRSCYNAYQEDKELARKVKDKNLYGDISHEMEEWFADIFSKSFILHATSMVSEDMDTKPILSKTSPSGVYLYH